MEVPRYFKISTVAQMLGGLSERFVSDEAKRGRFYPLDAQGAPDTSAVVELGGSVMVSLAGVLWYVRTRGAWRHAESAASFLACELAGVEPVAVLEPGVLARSEADLRRKAS